MILLILFLSLMTAVADICETDISQSEQFWRDKIELNLAPQLGQTPAKVNAFITTSYLDFYNMTSNQSEIIKHLGLVYAHASNHLGRLTRYHTWPDDHHLKDWDRSLIKGASLNLLLNLTPGLLAKKLMHYSTQLYRELAWIMLAVSQCGKEHLPLITKEPLLNDLANSSDDNEFIRHFVQYEQTYLQSTLYADAFVVPLVKNGGLDHMRFIPFMGVVDVSFKTWCQEISCATSSYHLENRIAFDVEVIQQEVMRLKQDDSHAQRSLNQSRIEEIIRFIRYNL